jgi:proline iminopeptidase
MKSRLNVTTILVATFFALFAFARCKKEMDVNEPGNLVPKTVTEDFSLPSISVNNTMLHAETFGNQQNPIVVVLHGGPGADYRSMLNCKTLANDGYFVVFFDQRGSGLSQRHDKNIYNIQLLLDDLTAVIQHYRKSAYQKVFLLGHSWGAMLATAYINTYPSAVSGAILAEPGGFNWQQTSDYVSRTRKSNVAEEATNDQFYVDQLLTGRENEHNILDYKMGISAAYDSRPGNEVGNAGPVPFWRYGSVISTALFDIAEKENFDWRTNLSQYKTKVLFCYSELNTAYGAAHAQLLASSYPTVQLEKINGCGHEILYFGWDRFYPIAKTYLNSLR